MTWLAELDPEQRQRFRQLPANRVMELFETWKRRGLWRAAEPQEVSQGPGEGG